MSRYKVTHANPHLTVVVGYDGPLQTFFGSVVDDRIPEDQDDCVFWVGSEAGELPGLGELVAAMQPWVVLSADLLSQLAQDLYTSPPQTPLQKHMLAILKRVKGMPLVVGTALLGLSLSAQPVPAAPPTAPHWYVIADTGACVLDPDGPLAQIGLAQRWGDAYRMEDVTENGVVVATTLIRSTASARRLNPGVDYPATWRLTWYASAARCQQAVQERRDAADAVQRRYR